MTAPLHVVILAAGEGKRMKSSLPKVLQTIAGRPMLAHVIDAARALQPARHPCRPRPWRRTGARRPFAGQSDLHWAEQARQLGTGHAVQQAMPGVPDGAQVLVLYGDVPLITRRHACDACWRRRAASPCWSPTSTTRPATAASSAMPRAASRAIVEHKDADDEQRRIRTVNTGILAAEATALKRWLQRLSNDNAQGEYYLTDVFAQAAAEYSAADMVRGRRCGGNRRRERSLATGAARARVPAPAGAGAVRAGRALRRSGALRHPRRRCTSATMSRSTSTSCSKAPWSSATACASARSAASATSKLAAGTEVRAHCDIDGARTEGAVQVGPFARLRPGHRARRRRARRQFRRDQERAASASAARPTTLPISAMP